MTTSVGGGGEPGPSGPRPARVATSTLSVFRDLGTAEAQPSGSWLRRVRGDGTATAAAVAGAVTTLVACAVGLVGSARFGLYAGGRTPVLIGFGLVVALALGATLAAGHALVNHRRGGTGGSGRAVLGAGTAIVWTTLLATMLFGQHPPERDLVSREVISGGHQSVTTLSPGDCLADPPAAYDDPLQTVRLVPCDEAHDAEVIAVHDLDPAADLAAACGRGAPLVPTERARAEYAVGMVLCLAR